MALSGIIYISCFLYESCVTWYVRPDRCPSVYAYIYTLNRTTSISLRLCVHRLCWKRNCVIPRTWHYDWQLHCCCSFVVVVVRSFPAQPINTRKSQSRKQAHKSLRASWISQTKCRPRLIIVKSCYFDYIINKPFPCSRRVICVSCSLHVISTYHVRKGSWAFYYP